MFHLDDNEGSLSSLLEDIENIKPSKINSRTISSERLRDKNQQLPVELIQTNQKVQQTNKPNYKPKTIKPPTKPQIKPTSNPIPKPSSDLFPVSMVHHKFKNLFGFNQFNKLQSKCFRHIYESDENVVISAPTGSGKSCCLELGIVRLFEKYLNKKEEKGKHKIIYVAPVKALVQEKFLDWKKKFSSIGYQVGELTGDSFQTDVSSMDKYDIILTTPEKYDSLSRKWKDTNYLPFIKSIELILIDEVHLLNEERGAVLEAIVSRIKSISSIQQFSSRIIALSATIPNIEDVAQWLDVASSDTLVFGDDYRGSKLELKVQGFQNDKKNYFVFDKNLDHKVFQIIRDVSMGKPSLVFCCSRNSVVKCSVKIMDDANSYKPNYFINSQAQKQRLLQASSQIEDNQLKELVQNGIGIHSAQLSKNDRNIIEQLFSTKDLSVICTTSTLSQGLNTPAYLVIVKGTKIYQTGGYREYPSMNVLQMIGRAGRAGYEESGMAVILTDSTMVDYYKSIQNSSYCIESTLHKYLFEHLNAEICLGSIRNMKEALYWLKSTFLYVRLIKNSQHYGLECDGSEQVDQKLEDILNLRVGELLERELIQVETEIIKPTQFGLTMSRLYIQYKTMSMLLKSIRNGMTERKVLELACSASEFEDYSIRQGEKGVLIKINQEESLRHKVKGNIESHREKIFLLIQSQLSKLPIESASLRQQAVALKSPLSRILSCIFEISKSYGFGLTCRATFNLSRKIQVGSFESGSVLPSLTVKQTQYGFYCNPSVGSVHSEPNKYSLLVIETQEGIIVAQRKICDNKGFSVKCDLGKLEDTTLNCFLCNSYGDEYETKVRIITIIKSPKRKLEAVPKTVTEYAPQTKKRVKINLDKQRVEPEPVLMESVKVVVQPHENHQILPIIETSIYGMQNNLLENILKYQSISGNSKSFASFFE